MLSSVFLISWSNHSAPLPIRGLSALEVFPRILEVGIGLIVLWHSLLFVGFWGFDDVGWLSLVTRFGDKPLFFRDFLNAM